MSTEKNKPMELALEFLEQSGFAINAEYRFINHEIGLVASFLQMQSNFFRIGQPYRAKEGRIIRTLKGKAVFSVNLIEYNIEEKATIVVPPGSIIQIMDFSPDFDFQMIATGYDFLPDIQRSNFANSFMKNGIVTYMTDDEWLQSGTYFSMLWDTVWEVPFRREVVQHLISALLYNIWYIQNRNQNSSTFQLSRQEEVFRRFIALVNEHSKRERSIGFYADKLCLTPHYLSTVIRQVSQQTVMQWINQAVILEAKVLLKHSDMLVFQISDELNFPNPSFFSKFFKRMTGMTPAEYQKKI